MKDLRPLLVGAASALLGAVVLPLTGLLDLAASSGHWPITDWYFHLAARQSVTLGSAGIAAPPLDDRDMVRRGAGHYDLVCATCHGSPASPPSQIARDLTPAPPLLIDQLDHWRPDARIFWTVKHGIKHTAMPAWPTALRDDEIWNMVAFLKAMPDMDAEAYRAAAGTSALGICTQCHGEDGSAEGTAYPRLDIQSPEYLAAALQAFRAGTRASGTMMAAAARLSTEEIETFAETFGKRTTVPANADPAGAGAEIARSGIPERDIAACESCHGATARPGYPRLAGQNRDYLVQQLMLFTTLGAERGGPFAHIMADAVAGISTEAPGLSPEEIEAVADWYGR